MKMVIIVLCVITVVLVGGIFGLTLAFRGADHSQFDQPRPVQFAKSGPESAAHNAMVERIKSDRAAALQMGQKEALDEMRRQMDERGAAFQIEADIQMVHDNAVKGEWVVAPGADPKRRLLYVHGGAYMVGSPKSHRQITSRLSKIANAAVFAVDYRLMPEHARMDGIDDCRNAYQWIIQNGPDGQNQAETLILAGDSSGGNLVLSTIAWARDNGLRAADAVVTMSPQTDLTLSSPSLVINAATDVMQGESFGPVVKAPLPLRLGFSFMMHKGNPSDPVLSPLQGDLANLPPTLVQASNVEMFLDDAVRYVNKANAAGSVAEIQIWPEAMHVWQAFEVPEADEAFGAMEAFIAVHAGG